MCHLVSDKLLIYEHVAPPCVIMYLYELLVWKMVTCQNKCTNLLSTPPCDNYIRNLDLIIIDWITFVTIKIFDRLYINGITTLIYILSPVPVIKMVNFNLKWWENHLFVPVPVFVNQEEAKLCGQLIVGSSICGISTFLWFLSTGM